MKHGFQDDKKKRSSKSDINGQPGVDILRKFGYEPSTINNSSMEKQQFYFNTEDGHDG